MKTRILVFLLLSGVPLIAQLRTLPSGYEPQPAHFRIVNGRLYNIVISTNWTELALSGRTHIVADVFTNGIVVQEFWQRAIYGPPKASGLARAGGFTGTPGPAPRDVIDVQPEYGRFKFLMNFPERVTRGEKIGNPTAMRVGTFRWQGQELDAYDHGLPNTPANRQAITNTVDSAKAR